MANKWNNQFIEKQLNQFWKQNTDSPSDLTWNDKELPNGKFNLLADNPIAEELNSRYQSWELLPKYFAETTSQWLSFAGRGKDSNNRTFGFIVFTTKDLSEFKIVNKARIGRNASQVELTYNFQNMYDYENDLHGQLFVLADLGGVDLTIFVLSNPFVVDDVITSDNESLLSVKQRILVDKNNLEWETVPSDADWNNFIDNRNNLEYHIALDIANTSPAEQISIICYHNTISGDSSTAMIYILEFVIWGKSTLRKSKEDYTYPKNVTPQLDLKIFDERYFITSNIYQIVSQETMTLTSDAGYNNFVANISNNHEVVNDFINVSPSINLSRWDNFAFFKGNATYNWMSTYYEWLRGFNGRKLIGKTNDITIWLCTERSIGGTPLPNAPDFRPYTNGKIVDRFFEQAWADGSGSWGWFTLELGKNWVDSNNIIQVDTTFKRSDGLPFEPTDQTSFLSIFIVQDFVNTVTTKFHSDPRLSGTSQWIVKADNIKFNNGVSQTLYFENDGKIESSTFTVTKDGSIDITTNNTIIKLPYSTTNFSVPALTNQNSLNFGYINDSGVAYLKKLVFTITDNKVVISSQNDIEIAPNSQSIFITNIANEVLATIGGDSTYITYNLNQKIVSKKIVANYSAGWKLFIIYKDNNSIQIRYLLDDIIYMLELPYTSSLENTTYFREPRFTYLNNMDIQRISSNIDLYPYADNQILLKNYEKLTFSTVLQEHELNNISINNMQLINNNNQVIVESTTAFVKDQYEKINLGFHINLLEINDTASSPKYVMKKYFNDPTNLRIVKLKYTTTSGSTKTIDISASSWWNQINNKLYLRFNTQ